MRFLANENFPAPSISILRGSGHDVSSIQERHPGVTDTEVIILAKAEARIILTFDKDYGEIIFKHGYQDPPAVVFLRYRGNDPSMAAQFVLDLIANGDDLTGAFTVIERDGIRQRRY
jgi:predicted nuclease of predicted toxin-antitoxin system